MATSNNIIINQTPTPLSSPQRKLPQSPPSKETPSRQLNPNSAPFQPSSSMPLNNVPTVSVSSPASSSYRTAANDSTLDSNDSMNTTSSSVSSLNGGPKSRGRRPRRARARTSASSSEAGGSSQNSRAEDEEGDDEEESESDVEIYLSTIDLNSSLIDEHPISLSFNSNASFDNSTSNGQNPIFNDKDRNLIARPSAQHQALPDDSPVLPTTHTFTSVVNSTSLVQQPTHSSDHSPPPPAPLRQTVPLPDIGPDSEAPGIGHDAHCEGARPSSRPSTGKKSTSPKIQPKLVSSASNGGGSTPSSTTSAQVPPPSTDIGSGGSEIKLSPPKLTIDTTATMASATLGTSSSIELKSPVDVKSPTGSAFGAETKTTNVYINGLPPHFPEEDLYKLASPYGAIRSVRTFTRHVRDSESGYGFVLFETIEAAERCIQDLRRYRNLHPTFSKASHKIPGTYAAADLTLPPSTSDVLLDWQQHQTGISTSVSNGALSTYTLPNSTSVPEIIGTSSCERREPAREASFKSKMESLQDPNSTNLYMEGLPLSIDEPTLAALVSPHKISSSRFFQTRLSNPPRIIAFVRLETRMGAEDVIERLHGRMVRGWNDSGSRISVRFADTAEQRELRRTERNTRDGDQSPGRLTIAQASLLNLHGQSLQAGKQGMSSSTSSLSVTSNSGGLSLPSPPILLDRLAPPQSGLPASRSLDNFNGYDISRTRTPPFAVDYSLVNNGLPLSNRAHSPVYYPQQQLSSGTHPSLNALSLQQQLLLQQQQQLNSSYQHNQLDPQMLALLDSLRASGSPFQPNHVNPAQLGRTANVGLENTFQPVGLGPNVGPRLGGGPPIVTGRGAVQAKSGYTATEEYIMRAHLEGQAQQQQATLDYLDATASNPTINQMILRNNALRQSQQEYAAQLDELQRMQDRRRPPPLDLSFQQQQPLLDQGQLQQSQRRERSDSLAISSTANIGVGVRGYRTQAAVLEHRGQREQEYQSYELEGDERNDAMDLHHSDRRQRQSITSLQQALSPQLTSSANQGTNTNGSAFQHAHLRSSTLPYRTPSRGQQRHSQTSSMSAAAPALGHGRQTSQSHHQRFSHSRGQNNVGMDDMDSNGGEFNIHEHMDDTNGITSPNLNDMTIRSPPIGAAEVSKLYLQAQLQHRRQIRQNDQGNGLKTAAEALAAGVFDQDVGSNNTSPSLSIISPALSYTANTPASTLSPATPFFNSFGNSVQIGGESGMVGSNGKANAVTMNTVQAAFESAKMRNGGQ